MLELIVLGEIPGTGVIVSFQGVLIAAGLLTGAIISYSVFKRRLALNAVLRKEAKI